MKVLLAAICLLFSQLSFAVIPPLVNHAEDNTEITLETIPNMCGTTPIRFQVYLNGQYQDDCTTSSDANGALAICYFRHPEINKVNQNLTVRVFDCQTNDFYDNQARISTAYTVNKLYPYDNLVSVRGYTYVAKMDRATGVIYELYNKNATTEAGKELNHIHSHIGAGIQFASHHGQKYSLTHSACGEQGYWNPTQAGALCGYPTSERFLFPPMGDVQFLYNDLQWIENRLYNFDYGPEYQGPYNEKDLFYLGEGVRAFPNFLELSYNLKSMIDMPVGVSQLLTFYMHHYYRNMRYKVNNTISNLDLPITETVYKLPYNKILPKRVDWVTFEMDHFIYGKQVWTLATIPSRMMNRVEKNTSTQTPWVSLTGLYKRFNYSYNIALKYPVGTDIKFWVLIIPNAPEDIISTPFGDITVNSFIEKAKDYYLINNNPLPFSTVPFAY